MAACGYGDKKKGWDKMSVKKCTTVKYIGEGEHEGFSFKHEPLEGSLTIEKTVNGYQARYLVPDDDARSPDEDGDDNLFLVGYHRDFSVDHKGIDKEMACAIAENDKENDEAKEYVKKYHVFSLDAYIHSGVRLFLSGGATVDRAWDVSQLGLVFVAKTEWETREKAKKAALGLIETWNAYLSGDVYGCIREEYDGKKKQIEHDACWGYSGHEYALEELKTF